VRGRALIEARERASVLTALALVQLFFALHYVAAKLVFDSFTPRAYALIRVAAAAGILLVVALLLRRRFPPLRDWGRIGLYAFFGVVVNQVCFIEGLSRTTATHSALLNSTIPVETLLVACLLGHESLTLRRALSVLVALAGVLLLIHPERSAFGSATLAGDLITLVNGASYAVFLVISKRYLARADTLAVTALMLALGTLGIAVIGLPDLVRLDAAAVPAGDWGLMAGIVLLPTAGAYLLNNWALARVEASLVALFIYLQPVLATALAVWWLGESPGMDAIAGGALIFLGVAMALRRAPASPAAPLPGAAPPRPGRIPGSDGAR
jgi:drug/metabolite transporter (DMT)-like permease